MIGEKFSRLTVVAQDTTKPRGNRYWKCLCDCGNTVVVKTSDLRSGNTKSCGCYKSSNSKERMTTHGESNTKLYAVWNTMMSRCYNPKTERYGRYGGRGITVCKEWLHNYPAFRDWAVANGYQDGLTIDRINLDGNYCPENCRWVTSAEQARNTSANRYITFNGETHILSDWARKTGLTAATINKRLKRGWSVEKALTTITMR